MATCPNAPRLLGNGENISEGGCADPVHGWRAPLAYRAHGKCRLSRKTKEAARSIGRAGQGRPLGLFGAWLSMSHRADMATSFDHVHIGPTVLSLEDRIDGRNRVAGEVGAQRLFLVERPRRDGEPEEPTEIP